MACEPFLLGMGGSTGKIVIRQSLALIERCQVLQAIPQFHVEWKLHQRTPIARFESQRNELGVDEDQVLCFGVVF